MNIAKALLFFLVFMSGLFWFMSWNWAQAEYLPIEELLPIQGKVVSIGGRQGKTDGWLTLNSNNKTMRFTLWIGKQTLKKFGDVTGEEVVVKIHPASDFTSRYTPLVRHFELVSGPVVLDYEIDREKHFEYMKVADDITLFLKSLFFIFMTLFLLCFFKRESSATSEVKKQPKTRK